GRCYKSKPPICFPD
nr:Chain C, Trypsin inhibitor 1 [Helianthus annuus]6D3X_D Chain D, Trypsin inhibitor 1 [Helianthus annuus]6U7S_A Chain A, GLY-ARG-CYS-TYR-LYS-SER-LYS-PRO-PRO-ILE-CYS-PHE-PRO-ASP inhibitor [Helianthus annuus]